MINYSDEKYITDAVNKFSDTVFRVAYQYTGNRADAEDILQDVFLKLLRAFQTGDDNRLKAWLIRVTINRSKDFLRAKKRRRETLLNDYAQPEPHGEHSEVFEALGKLSERDRNALYLHYYEGYTAKEIAEITGDKERAVTKRIARARIKLKDFLEE